MGSQPLLLNQKPKHLQKLTMALMDMVLDIEAMDMADTMVMDTVMDTHTTDTDTDTDITVARDPPMLKLPQPFSMVPMPHTLCPIQSSRCRQPPTRQHPSCHLWSPPIA